MRLFRRVRHLVARFVTSLPSTPPAGEDEIWADEHFLAGERTLWVEVDNRDRRHSIRVARRFIDRRPQATRAEVAGALLHDVGKIDCRLGTFGRVAATVVGPHGRRFRSYHDHEEIGAEMAREVGSDPATVELVAGRGPAYPDLRASDRA
ncbi:MAG: HDIG domain-containing metalloprotein [Ilumatobacteraceae bacterium]